jgi:hypothetical protein
MIRLLSEILMPGTGRQVRAAAIERDVGEMCLIHEGQGLGGRIRHAENNFRRIMGFKDLWMLEVALGRKSAKGLDKEEEAA